MVQEVPMPRPSRSAHSGMAAPPHFGIRRRTPPRFQVISLQVFRHEVPRHEFRVAPGFRAGFRTGNVLRLT